MTAQRPNILLLFMDDQRFNTIRALGNDAIQTPNMDRLVQSGTTFTHACIPGGTSGAVCMPSRAMLHTGRTLFHIQDQGQQISQDHTLLGEHLRQQGYQTFGTGKWHNGVSAYARSFSAGANIFFGGMADHWNVPVHDFDPAGKYEGRLPYCTDAFTSNEVKWHGGDYIHAGCHSSELLADGAVTFLKEYDQNSPFFLYVSFLAPHDPRTMPERFRTMYDPDSIELPPNFLGGHPFDNGALHIRDEELAGFPRSPEDVRKHIAEYYAMISHLDFEIGRILDALDASGQADNTIVVLAGDNGLAVGQHGLMGKQSLYDHSVRVPLMMKGPGIAEGERCDTFVYLLDIFPTLCQMIDAPVPDSVEGMSFHPCLRETDHVHRDDVYLAYTQYQRGIRTQTHKLIECQVNGTRTTQLFDVKSDPWEINNLAGDPAHAQTVDALRQRLFEMRDTWGDRDTEMGKTFWSGF